MIYVFFATALRGGEEIPIGGRRRVWGWIVGRVLGGRVLGGRVLGGRVLGGRVLGGRGFFVVLLASSGARGYDSAHLGAWGGEDASPC
jgi:hypothetical protein